ncbi:MAG: hypothetical protein NTV34_15885 [Proteobacteria bacterium]|nr:hypothetical protein [Pseudomonadota bacterium]
MINMFKYLMLTAIFMVSGRAVCQGGNGVGGGGYKVVAAASKP